MSFLKVGIFFYVFFFMKKIMDVIICLMTFKDIIINKAMTSNLMASEVFISTFKKNSSNR